MNLFEIRRNLADIMITDDALDALKTSYLVGNIGFEIDPVKA